MGQGLHTKLCQVAAQSLGVPVALVRVEETASDKVPNASPTAASMSSDLYGAAVLHACAQLNERLEPVRQRLREQKGREPDWKSVVAGAYYNARANLSAQGFHAVPRIGFDFDTPTEQ